MDDVTETLWAVLDHPEENTPRLMHADALLERNGPGDEEYARFIIDSIEGRPARLPVTKNERFKIGYLTSRIVWDRGFIRSITLDPGGPSWLEPVVEMLHEHPIEHLRYRVFTHRNHLFATNRLRCLGRKFQHLPDRQTGEESGNLRTNHR